MAKQQVTLVQANAWFEKEIIPKRTTVAGFSGNRLWKTPRGLVTGNTEDPDGLCGDATLFVVEEFYRAFGDYRTSDGFHIGMVLWKGEITNHIAAVQLIGEKVQKTTYAWDSRMRRVTRLDGKRGCYVPAAGYEPYSTAALLRLTVYDLYYKQAPQGLAEWWRQQDSARGGEVTIGLQHDFAE